VRSSHHTNLFAICLAISIASWAGPSVTAASVLVESVEEASTADQAGIKPGDLLVSWAQTAAESPQPLASPFELLNVEIEYGPRGPVRFQCMRDGEPFATEVLPGKWGLVVGPAAGGAEPAWLAYRQAESLEQALEYGEKLNEQDRLRLHDLLARRLAAKRDLERAIEIAAPLVARREQLHPDSLSLAFSLSTLATVQQYGGNLEAAIANHERALQIRASLAPGSLAEADSLLMLGMVATVRGILDEGSEYCAAALSIHEQRAPDSPELGRNLMWVGAVSRAQGDLVAAESFFRRAVELQQRVSPGSSDLASSMDQLAIVLRYRGDLDGAEELGEKALAIQRKLAPDGSAVASALNSLGVLSVHRGDLAGAQAHFAESLAIRQRLTPGGIRVATAMNNLGYVANERGDLATAEKYFFDAMEIYERHSPDSMEAVQGKSNLAGVAAKRGDLALAEKRYLEVLAFNRKQMPGSFDLAIALANVGNMALELGDFDLAERSFHEAAAIHAELNPDSVEAAGIQMGFGHLARKRGDLAAAEAHYRKSLTIQRKNSPASIKVADSLYQLGRLAYLRGDLEQAEESLQASLAISRRLTPASVEVADSSYFLGRVYRGTERPAQAMAAFEVAVAALEAQRSRLGGSHEAGSGWASTYAGYYRDYVDLLVAQERPEEALELLERSHARGLLAMLAERDLVLRGDISEKLERRRLAINVRQDDAQQQMAQLDTEQDKAAIEKLVQELETISQEREAVIAAIRRESPRLASLRNQEPLDLAGVRGALDPGTVMLAYSIGHERSLLFVVNAESDRSKELGLDVIELPIGREALDQKVDGFRAGVRRQQAPGAVPLDEVSRELYELLIRPAEKIIDRGERVLISPDGPLHTLPFNALLREIDDGRTQYFIEWKPLHTVVSATVYGELKGNRAQSQAAKTTLVAFGDPQYSGLAPVALPDKQLAPLQWSRQEVEGIAELFPERAKVFVGAQASEDRAMTASRDVRFVHFATHAILDERFPLNSALALSIPEDWTEGRPNGLLQAWEIFESLRLRADLVTLSGCETALGTEVEGEGLNSLTRAFIYAGAQSVLASLWSVADRSTSELMTGFYTHLSRGMNKDEALRAAQIALLRSADSEPGDEGTRGVRGLAGGASFSHPYHWAAFQLVGDWR